MWYGRARPLCDIGILRELNEVAEHIWGDDLQHVCKELTDASNPKLELESVVQGPEKGVLLIPLGVLLEVGLQPVGQDVGATLGIDLPDVVSIELALVSGLRKLVGVADLHR